MFTYGNVVKYCRDLLHIAGMGSALGVGFNPNSPDPRHQAEQQQQVGQLLVSLFYIILSRSDGKAA